MEERVFFKNSKGDKLCGILFDPIGNKNKPIIVLVHGSPNSDKNSSTNIALTKKLNKNQISSFRFDIFGHGESEGEYQNLTIEEAVNDTNQAIILLRKLGYKKIGLFGSSYGGEAAILTASEKKKLYILVLKCPVANFDSANKISVPTLIIHGDTDTEVPVEQSIKLSKLIPNCQLKIIKGAGHRFQEGNTKEEMLNAIVDFIVRKS